MAVEDLPWAGLVAALHVLSRSTQHASCAGYYVITLPVECFSGSFLICLSPGCYQRAPRPAAVPMRPASLPKIPLAPTIRSSATKPWQRLFGHRRQTWSGHSIFFSSRPPPRRSQRSPMLCHKEPIAAAWRDSIIHGCFYRPFSWHTTRVCWASTQRRSTRRASWAQL